MNPAPVNKSEVLSLIIAKLTADAELYLRAARAAQFEATDEQSKAENKYDTRGLEASYLARGQSRQMAEAEQALQLFRRLAGVTFAAETPIDLGALVNLKGRRGSDFYFVGPSMGGTEVTCDGEEVTVVTPQSPLGQQLVGRKSGDKVKMPSGEDRKIQSVT